MEFLIFPNSSDVQCLQCVLGTLVVVHHGAGGIPTLVGEDSHHAGQNFRFNNHEDGHPSTLLSHVVCGNHNVN